MEKFTERNEIRRGKSENLAKQKPLTPLLIGSQKQALCKVFMETVWAKIPAQQQRSRKNGEFATHRF
ncbi:MAG: hypothetical protein IJZ08_00120 [Clostridia bacterium]|nr:hypothetical protein [Clostridia bacterium]